MSGCVFLSIDLINNRLNIVILTRVLFSALAKLATHFEPGYVWESGGFTFFRPTINASDGMNGQYYT